MLFAGSIQLLHFLSNDWSEGNHCSLRSLLQGYFWRFQSLLSCPPCNLHCLLDMFYLLDVVLLETFGLIWLVMFSETKHKIQKELKFTLPGKERQDSVYSGLQVNRDYFFSIVKVSFILFFFLEKACHLLPDIEKLLWSLCSSLSQSVALAYLIYETEKTCFWEYASILCIRHAHSGRLVGIWKSIKLLNLFFLSPELSCITIIESINSSAYHWIQLLWTGNWFELWACLHPWFC